MSIIFNHILCDEKISDIDEGEFLHRVYHLLTQYFPQASYGIVVKNPEINMSVIQRVSSTGNPQIIISGSVISPESPERRQDIYGTIQRIQKEIKEYSQSKN